ncbi:hypothetical protein FRC09_005472 [Ceratobasidium sp. 395]|nr:hypothetical protein FRC09_005472 [Ceratobasidium sp. 395]
MHIFSTLAIAAASLFASSNAAVVPRQSTSWVSTPFNPPSIPLAVRSPYLSAWLPGGNNGGRLNTAWPTFWTGSFLGWAGYVRVDGKVYTILGAPNVPGPTLANQKSMQFTATKSIFVMSAGPIDVTVTFLSPVEPTDYLRQSIPFSYMTLTSKSTDGKSHSIQYYTDISAEWVSGDNSLTATWSTNNLNGAIAHQVQLQNQGQYKEVNDHTQYGSAYYGTNTGSGLTYATGQDTVVRAQFVSNGNLGNSQDNAFRAISDRWPVFAFARDIGSTADSSGNPVVFAIGHVRDPLVTYITTGNVMQERHPYWLSKYANANDLATQLSAFLSSAEYQHAVSASNAMDTKINNDSNAVSSDYAAITSLSLRQAFGGTEVTISKTSSGAYDTNDIFVYLKEISSDGNMNTIDVVFPAWPVYLYLNPDFGKRLLAPIFTYQRSGLYPNKWSVHDLGSSYPVANGHNNGGDEAMPVEESGNMIIMALSYYRATKDSSQLSTNYALLKQWTQYLIEDSLIPADQLSTDDFAGHLANQTNLAVKGIVGIRAMSEIATVLGQTADATTYSNTASSYVTQWQKYAISSEGHLQLQYNNPSSWGIAYNLWADKLFGYNLFPASVYTMQTSWYGKKFGTYGVPLDTRHTYTKSDWQIFTAGTVTDTNTRNRFVSGVKGYVANGLNNRPFSDWYDTSSGASVGFINRPVVGGHFALLVLPK